MPQDVMDIPFKKKGEVLWLSVRNFGYNKSEQFPYCDALMFMCIGKLPEVSTDCSTDES